MTSIISKYYFVLILFLLTISASCNKDDSSPVLPSNKVNGFMICQVNFSTWSAEGLEVSRQQNTLHIKGRRSVSGSNTFTASEINFRIINLNQPGTFGIGENEPGFQYFVKGSYTLISNEINQNIEFTAYYLDYSLMKINSITSKSIEAEFNMKLFNEDFSDSLLITTGRMNLEF